MSVSEDLFEWAAAKGVVLNGIAPQRIPGRGIGVLATRPLKPREVILKVPLSAFHTRDTIPPQIARKLPRITIHGLLAASIALQAAEDDYPSAPWRAAFPSAADFESTTPFFFPEELQACLPGPARDLLKTQGDKFASDWAIVQPAFGDVVSRESYAYHWFLVNTRSFYHVTPSTRALPPSDRMVMISVADLLNHAPEGCKETFSSAGLSITTDRAYAEGEEVYICYGRHSNDFLLAEYGFVPDGNTWDEISLDEVIEPRIDARGRKILEDLRFWGRYRLDENTAGCYRSQVALRIACGAGWRAFVDGWETGDEVQKKVDAFLKEILSEYLGTIEERIGEVEGATTGTKEQKEAVVRRWVQVGDLVARTIEKLAT
ncbi:hypothetical protein jhhlp_004760 [Lomentospora prolificans]|uniref:SET domain-containing protein n=1 Tax=Lomentospora prolificans TaxID=41688 RepID=A0A2N3N8I6_9PEZI|nr:hypothetical protein jhhlp_004760 [Lomentospora prolificans]